MAPLNETEMRLLVTAFETAKTPLQPDYEAIAQRLGYKNKGIASTMWNRIKKKLDPSANASATPSPTKKRGRGKGAANEDTEGDDDEPPTPTPKRQKTPKSALKKGKKLVDSESEDGDKLDSKSGIKDEIFD